MGNITLSLPLITSVVDSGSITNSPLGTIEATPPDRAPTIILAPFTNLGNLRVDSGVNLTLVGAAGPSGASTADLDGVMQLMGNLTLQGPIDSPTGFVEDAAPGFLVLSVGNTVPPAVLTVGAGAIGSVNGNLEVTGGCTLTGAGEVINNGRVQLDASGSTTGLGSYQQLAEGTLAVDEAPSGFPTVLAVTGAAQLSGNLILLNYAPVVGASFVVVTAGSISGHFDTIPDGMEETDGPDTVTVTQVQPPAGS